MVYQDVLNSSIHEFIKIYSNEIYKPLTEMDIQGYIFALCLNQIKTGGLEENIHINVPNKALGPRKKIDIVLNEEIALEVKFEADYPGVSKPVAFTEEIFKDISRLKDVKNSGFKYCAFFLIDEDGMHYRKLLKETGIPEDKWMVVNKAGKERFILFLII